MQVKGKIQYCIEITHFSFYAYQGGMFKSWKFKSSNGNGTQLFQEELQAFQLLVIQFIRNIIIVIML